MNRIAGAILILAGTILIAASNYFDPLAKIGIGITLAVGGVIVMATANMRINDDNK